MRVALTAIAVLAMLSLGAQEVRIDPELDPRLKHRVSVRMVAEPLIEVVRALSQQSGVVMTVARPIAEYRATLVIKDRPLHEVMTRLQEAFDFQWERNGETPEQFRYRFYQTDIQREAERRAYQALRDGWKRRLRNFLARHRDLLERGDLIALQQRLRGSLEEEPAAPEPLPPPDEAKMRQLFDESPFSVTPPGELQLALAYMVYHGGEPLLERIERGNPIVISSRDPATRRLVPPNFPKLWAAQTRRYLQDLNERGDSPPYNEIRASLEEQAQRIEQAQAVEFWFHLDPEGQSGEMQVILYDHKGEVITREGDTIGFHFSGLLNERILLVNLRRAPPEPPEGEVWKQRLKPFQWSKVERWWTAHEHRLAQAAEESGLALVAESYPLELGAAYGESPFASDWAGLLRYWHRAFYDWRVDGDWLILSHCARYLARSVDIPEATLRRWLLNPEVMLEHIAEVAQLHGEQINILENMVSTTGKLALPKLELAPLYHAWSSALQRLRDNAAVRWALRLYAALPTPQQQRLQAGQTLELSRIPRAAQQALLQLNLIRYRTGESGGVEAELPQAQRFVAIRLVQQRNPYPTTREFAPAWMQDNPNDYQWLEAQPESVRQRFRQLLVYDWYTFKLLDAEGNAASFQLMLIRRYEPESKPRREKTSR
jgi:hypothetical protein